MGWQPSEPIKISSSRARWLPWAYALGLPAFVLITTLEWGMAVMGLFVGALAGGFSYLYESSFPEVLLVPGNLVIRDGTQDRLIPLSSLRKVRESRWSRTKHITIEFETVSGKFDSIDFIPDYPLNLPMNHPIAKDLHRLANLEK